MKIARFLCPLVSVISVIAQAAPSCDTALGDGLCPDAFSLQEMGECLVEKKDSVDDDCKTFIAVNEKCSSELQRCGSDIAWGADSVLCVTAWTTKADLSAECAAVVDDILAAAPPAQAETSEESEASKKKKAARKAARKAAAQNVRNLNERKEKESRGASDKKSRKKSKAPKKKAKRSKEEVINEEEDLL
jgi:hypothetical protein